MKPGQAKLVERESGRRRVQLVECPRCGEAVVRGRACETLVMDVDCDLEPLDPVGEAMAWLAGRFTYRITDSLGGMQLNGPRSQFDLAVPANCPEVEVLVRHQCGTNDTPVSTRAANIVARVQPGEQLSLLDDEPPF